jgi:hypothetical protein
LKDLGHEDPPIEGGYTGFTKPTQPAEPLPSWVGVSGLSLTPEAPVWKEVESRMSGGNYFCWDKRVTAEYYNRTSEDGILIDGDDFAVFVPRGVLESLLSGAADKTVRIPQET